MLGFYFLTFDKGDIVASLVGLPVCLHSFHCPCSSMDSVLSGNKDILIQDSAFVSIFPTQNSFYNQLSMQKKSERFFKVFYDRLRLAQQEIRATVSVNMSELSCRKRDDDADVTGIRFKRGILERFLLQRFRKQVIGPNSNFQTVPFLFTKVENKPLRFVIPPPFVQPVISSSCSHM